MDTNHIWIQGISAKKLVEFQKINGIENCADSMTEDLGEVDINKYIEIIGAKFQRERAEVAAKVAKDVKSDNAASSQKGGSCDAMIYQEVGKTPTVRLDRKNLDKLDTPCQITDLVPIRGGSSRQGSCANVHDAEEIKHFKLKKQDGNAKMVIDSQEFVIAKARVDEGIRENESRSAFHTRTWQEVFRQYPSTSKDTDEIRKDVEEQENAPHGKAAISSREAQYVEDSKGSIEGRCHSVGVTFKVWRKA